MAARDRVLVEVQVGGQAAPDMRHTAHERDQQGLLRALDLDVPAGLQRVRCAGTAADAVIEAGECINPLGGSFDLYSRHAQGR
jgi:hypothetical protein